ncbi:hypothetical protein NDU88_002519 [Pleurodeles waltl]|uniref:Uncharacterized protein n=1 Tax=Pleurodeles waltl TaxID=8319 RepID=A0AAV7PFH2_PLEWA|nr:hypothetical protein NDU88_002519 [Pleurodeles waltl]
MAARTACAPAETDEERCQRRASGPGEWAEAERSMRRGRRVQDLGFPKRESSTGTWARGLAGAQKVHCACRRLNIAPEALRLLPTYRGV